MKQFLEVAEIINKRGLRGEVKAECLCDSPEQLKKIPAVSFSESGEELLRLLAVKPYKGFVYLTLEGIDTPEKADHVRGKSLYADRRHIPLAKGKHFIEDLIGLSVFDVDTGVEYGIVTEVFNRGASNIYTIEKNGECYYLPAVDEFVIRVELEKGIFVRPIKGIFDEAESV